MKPKEDAARDRHSQYWYYSFMEMNTEDSLKSICQDDTMEKCSLVEENRTQIVALKPEKPELSGRPHDPIEMPAHCCPAVKRFVLGYLF